MTTKTDTPITLAAWLVERQRVLEAFAADWRSHQAQAPEDWPEEMSAGDWDEQYAAYLETQDD